MTTSQRYAFGEFVLERAQKRVLRLDGSEVSLTPRLFDALVLFVEHAGRLLEKDTLFQALWPGRVVEENNLSQVVFSLRRALGDDSHGSRFIQTVPRRGFRFVAPVTDLPALDEGATAASPDVAPAQEASVSPSFARAAEGAAESNLAHDAVPPHSADVTKPGKRRWLQMAAAGGVAAGIGGMGWWVWTHRAASASAGAGPALAVLPFKPLMAEGRDELLELGMADSLIARLSKVPGLVVRSTGSVLRYAGPSQDLLRAARELNVTWIVDGTLQRRGDQLRATARLLRAADGSAVWSGSFDEKYANVFDVQDLIATRVAHALAPMLRADAVIGTHLSELGGTRSIDAYQLYLAARWRAQGGRAEDIQRGITLLDRALMIDPSYALAWTELAWTHRRKLWNSDTAPAEVFEPANRALQRALALAPTLAQARAGAGFSLYWFDFDWSGAEQAFRGALAGNPSVVSAHHGLALLLLTQGRVDEGFVHLRLARELEPMSPLFNTLEASYLLDSGQLSEARVRLDRAFDVAPNLWLAHVALGLLLMAEKQTDQGLAVLRRAVELGHDTSRPKAVLAVQLARAGQRDESRAILGGLLERAKDRFVTPTSIAAVHAALDEPAPALDALEQARRVRDTRLIFLKDDPNWNSLRREPRFVALMKELKLDRFGPGLTPV